MTHRVMTPSSRGCDIRSRSLTEHERAVRSAEIRRLVAALRPFGVLRRDALAQAAGAMRWHESDFELALGAAVEAGEIHELPLGFYAVRRQN
jgi:hypothetical protein